MTLVTGARSDSPGSEMVRTVSIVGWNIVHQFSDIPGRMISVVIALDDGTGTVIFTVGAKPVKVRWPVPGVTVRLVTRVGANPVKVRAPLPGFAATPRIGS